MRTTRPGHLTQLHRSYYYTVNNTNRKIPQYAGYVIPPVVAQTTAVCVRSSALSSKLTNQTQFPRDTSLSSSGGCSVDRTAFVCMHLSWTQQAVGPKQERTCKT